MAVSDWSTTAASNTTVGAVNIAENCPAANLNNAIREAMAQIAQWRDDLPDDYQGKDATLTALAGLTTAADQMIYATGVDTFALTTLSAFMRTLLDDADQAAACATLGAVRVSGFSLATPGYIDFTFGANTFRILWGTFTVGADSGTTVSYPAGGFANAGFPVLGGANANYGDTSPTENGPGITARTNSGFTAWNGQNNSRSMWFVAVGY